jgi:hypothetical protein
MKDQQEAPGTADTAPRGNDQKLCDGIKGQLNDTTESHCRRPITQRENLGRQVTKQVPWLRIEPYGDGSFNFTPDGVLAHCILVRGLGGRTEDTVAWLPDNPNKWWLNHRIGVVLGMAAVERAEYLNEPLRLFDTPADWVASGCEGACILDWAAPLAFYLPSEGRVLCKSEKVACKLRHVLTPPSPKVEVCHD